MHERSCPQLGKLQPQVSKSQVASLDLERIKTHQDERLCRGEVERLGGGEAINVTFQAEGEQAKRKFTAPLRDISAALDYLVRYIASDKSEISAIQQFVRRRFAPSGIVWCMAENCSRNPR